MSNIVTNLVKALDWEKLSQKPSPFAILILMVIADGSDDDGFCFKGQKSISELTHMSLSSVKRWMARLEDAGLMSRKYRFKKNGKRTSDGINLNLALITKCQNATLSQEARCHSDRSLVSERHLHIEETSVETSVKEIYKEKFSFEEFWSAFDYNRGKKECERIWQGNGLDENAAKITSRAKQYASSRFGEEKFWTWPKTWLINEGWNDELPGMRSTKPITPETKAAIEASREKPEPKISLPANHFMSRLKRGEFDEQNVRH